MKEFSSLHRKTLSLLIQEVEARSSYLRCCHLRRKEELESDPDDKHSPFVSN